MINAHFAEGIVWYILNDTNMLQINFEHREG